MGFAEQFMQGLMMGRAEQERKKQQALAEQWHQQQADMQKKQFERQAALDERGKALEDIKLVGMLPQPEQALPSGQAGPPMPLPKRTVNVPGFGVVTPPDLTDLTVQKRAQEDLERTNKLEDYGQQVRLQREAAKRVLPPETVAKLFPGQDPSEPVDMNVAQLAASIKAGEDARAAAEAARGAAAEATRQQRLDSWAAQQANKYRSEPIYKNYSDVLTKVSTVEELARQGTGPADVGLLNAYMKIVDPGGRVTVGEVATIQNAAGVPERIRLLYNKALTGQQLDPKTRAEIVAAAKANFEPYKKAKALLDQGYTARAKREGANPNDIITDVVLPESGGGSGVIEWGRDANGNPVQLAR